MKNFLNGLKKYFADFGTAVAKGDIWTKLSLIVMGVGYIARGQVTKGILVTLIEVAAIWLIGGFSWPYLQKLNTLGTVEREEIIDFKTLTKTTNDYDNSLLILLLSMLGFVIIAAFILLYIGNMKANYRAQLSKENGEHVNNFREDMRDLLDKKFHITLLAFPGLGVLVFTVVPLLFMILVAFTNYDEAHQPPTKLFTWVGLENFKTLFTSTSTITFGYAFVRVLAWTLIWAFFATFTTYIGGILLAKFINDKRTKWPKLWRTLFMVTIAIPQFVTLLLISKMFGDYGIVNTFCNKIGLTGFLQNIGLVSEGLSFIPFLSKPGWAHVMIILVNIWVGVPYQMLIATGVLLNIPGDQIESAKIDGATEMQIFRKITMPYMLFVTGPSLITQFIANINNFNVIYLLTNTYTTTNMSLANSNAKEVDLLVTWLFTLTSDQSNYKMASVIGIMVFLICAALSLIAFSNMIKGDREEEFQ